ncbi:MULTISPECIES: hypothetical protein [unclassified Yoonia]|uniref:hypothetical protein n=1 Tax=unclassified Yoonia TaxID=2629118 RepID=UPI002AFF2C2C|nr:MULTISPECIES: hypothetical protein [unclassified Yoonia]
MKAFLFAVVFAVIVAVGASFVLQGTFQQPSYAAFATEGARVGDPGQNLMEY